MVSYKGFVCTQHITLVRQRGFSDYYIKIPKDIYRLFSALKDRPQEECYAVTLTAKHQVIGIDRISVGSMTASTVHPREFFRLAILQGSVGIAMVHNHPSGDIVPSDHDIAITKRFQEASGLLGITFLDHIIIGDGEFYSFRESGIL